MGKTRLAFQAAADLLDDFSDGTFFVPLATLSEPELFLSAVAETLGVRESGEQPLFESLKDYLSERRMLLVLDNFEQVLEGPRCKGAARGCSWPEGSGNQPRTLGALRRARVPCSAPHSTRPQESTSLESLTQYEAVRLFVDRAQAVKARLQGNQRERPCCSRDLREA